MASATRKTIGNKFAYNKNGKQRKGCTLFEGFIKWMQNGNVLIVRLIVYSSNSSSLSLSIERELMEARPCQHTSPPADYSISADKMACTIHQFGARCLLALFLN